MACCKWSHNGEECQLAIEGNGTCYFTLRHVLHISDCFTMAVDQLPTPKFMELLSKSKLQMEALMFTCSYFFA